MIDDALKILEEEAKKENVSIADKLLINIIIELINENGNEEIKKELLSTKLLLQLLIDVLVEKQIISIDDYKKLMR